MIAEELIRKLPAVAALIAVVFVSGCSTPNQPVQPEETDEPADYADIKATRQEMGNVPVTIRAIGPDEQTCKKAINAAFERVEQLSDILSDYVSGSDIDRVNASAGKKPVKVSDEAFEATKLAVQWWRKTDKAFDPTVRPAVWLWKDADADDELPADHEIASAKALIGADKIELEASEKTVYLPVEEMSLDLGGIAKGYIVDQAVDVLREHGISSAVVDAGGDIYAMGKKPGDELWSIGVENPPPREELYTIVLSTHDKAVATSGDYRRGLYIQDKRYSHIIDPRTAMPVEHVISVTVIAPDLTTADALATALSVLGPAEGIELIENIEETEALILSRKDAKLQAVKSMEFARFVSQGKQRLTELTNGNN